MYMHTMHVAWLSSHDCHDCTTHDCQVFTTTTEASQSTTHDHDWFQSLIIFPELHVIGEASGGKSYWQFLSSSTFGA